MYLFNLWRQVIHELDKVLADDILNLALIDIWESFH